jgi:tRNA (uracil-5-)-methyltransferase TRM9
LTARFVQADLAQPGWETKVLHPSADGFDVVTCLATLHHLPGYDLRLATLAALTRLLAADGVLALSLWQFFDSPRLVAKQVAWAACDIDSAEVEPGDALLPWQQGTYAVRYVHQIDTGELACLAAATGLVIDATFRADGKEGNLNLYALLRRGERAEMER